MKFKYAEAGVKTLTHEPTSFKASSIRADNDAIVAQLDALREDMKKLASTVSSAAVHRKRALAKDISAGMTDAEAHLEHAVAENPLRALAVAAGVGLLLGVMWRR